MPSDLSRRKFLKIAGLGSLSAAGLALIQSPAAGIGVLNQPGVKIGGGHDQAMHNAVPGGADKSPQAPRTYGENRFDPTAFLTQFDYGTVTGSTPDGRPIREFAVISEDREIEVFPGVKFPAFTFNGTVPGPTFRCTEGDLLRFHYSNKSEHPHSMHFHGIHPPSMDGLQGVSKGGRFTYEFIADPFGVLPYHCHIVPLKKHIAKGLYGTLIVDPKEERPPATEMVMVMNGFDVDFDDENEFYTVNGVAFHYQHHPIQVKVGEPLRIYLVNLTEFDPVNSYHQHANMFRYYPNGTSLTNHILTDTISQGVGERGILEMTFKYPGLHLFHAHITEFAELGWVGSFAVSA